MIKLNYHHLYYFWTIAKSGSLVKSSETLLLAQPTLSLQLMQLEKSLGHRLFDRRKNRLILTDYGRFILGYVERIFEAGTELEIAVEKKVSPRRVRFEVGILNGTPRSFGHLLLETVMRVSPDVHVWIREGSLESLLHDLREYRLDAVLSDVSIRSLDEELFDNHHMAQVPIRFAASPSLIRRYPSVPDHLEGAPLILPSSPSRLYQEILDCLAYWKVKPRLVADIQDIELARRAAVSGLGIVPLNAFTLAVTKPQGALRLLNEKRKINLYESVYLVTRKRRHPDLLLQQLPEAMKNAISDVLKTL